MRIEKTVENITLRQEAVRLNRRFFFRMLMILLPLMLVYGSVCWGMNLLLQNPALPGMAEICCPLLMSAASAGLYSLCMPVFMGVSQGTAPSWKTLIRRKLPWMKFVGLQLLSALLCVLILLPVSISAADICFYRPDLAQVVYPVAAVLVLLIFGLIALRFVMAPFILTAEPERGLRDSLTYSTGLTRGRKWQLVRLVLPILMKLLGLYYLLVALTSFVLRLLGVSFETITALVPWLTIGPCFYFLPQMMIAGCLFCCKRIEERPTAASSYWLRSEPPKEVPDDRKPD